MAPDASGLVLKHNTINLEMADRKEVEAIVLQSTNPDVTGQEIAYNTVRGKARGGISIDNGPDTECPGRCYGNEIFRNNLRDLDVGEDGYHYFLGMRVEGNSITCDYLGRVGGVEGYDTNNTIIEGSQGVNHVFYDGRRTNANAPRFLPTRAGR